MIPAVSARARKEAPTLHQAGRGLFELRTLRGHDSYRVIDPDGNVHPEYGATYTGTHRDRQHRVVPREIHTPPGWTVEKITDS